MPTFRITESDVFCVWNARQTHRVSHQDFLTVLKAVDASEAPSGPSLIAATKLPGYMVYLVLGWLVAVGALSKVRKTSHSKVGGFRRVAALGWYGCDEDDLEDGAENLIFD